MIDCGWMGVGEVRVCGVVWRRRGGWGGGGGGSGERRDEGKSQRERAERGSGVWRAWGGAQTGPGGGEAALRQTKPLRPAAAAPGSPLPYHPPSPPQSSPNHHQIITLSPTQSQDPGGLAYGGAPFNRQLTRLNDAFMLLGVPTPSLSPAVVGVPTGGARGAVGGIPVYRRDDWAVIGARARARFCCGVFALRCRCTFSFHSCLSRKFPPPPVLTRSIALTHPRSLSPHTQQRHNAPTQQRHRLRRQLQQRPGRLLRDALRGADGGRVREDRRGYPPGRRGGHRRRGQRRRCAFRRAATRRVPGREGGHCGAVQQPDPGGDPSRGIFFRRRGHHRGHRGGGAHDHPVAPGGGAHAGRNRHVDAVAVPGAPGGVRGVRGGGGADFHSGQRAHDGDRRRRVLHAGAEEI